VKMLLSSSCLIAAACLLAVPATALAELSNDSIIGPGLRSRPAYDGSDSQHTEFVPVVRHFGDHWFVRSTQGVLEAGPRMQLATGLHAGAQLAYEPGRRASESAFLRAHAVPDIKRGASVGLQIEWDSTLGPVPVTVLGRIRKNIESDGGMQADVRLSVGVLRSGAVSAGVFTQATWADSTATNRLYGVTPAQSAAGGLAAFRAGAGLLSTSVGVLGSVELSRQWLVVGSVEARRLGGDAARSPLAERRSNHAVSVAAAYRF
jgi:outer membrane protein